VIQPGRPFPLGATPDEDGVNFAVFSKFGTRAFVCLFDPDNPLHEVARHELWERTAHVFHGYLPRLRPGALYGFRIDGPYRPEEGDRFNVNKLLIDPYARAVHGEVDWRGPIFGYPPDHPDRVTAAAALRKLLVIDGEQGYCQPCLSPVWDTALACHALMEVGDARLTAPVRRALDWLADKQVLDTVGDWATVRQGLRPGGWAFQYANPYYPDLDDTAAVALALDRFDPDRYRTAIDRAAEWVLGMQSRNGGWGSFDADNTHYYLNHIQFADHGALLDPPTADVSARCLGFLAQHGLPFDHPAVAAVLTFLRREQEADGSWFGRWGTNYIYGTWSVLAALNAIGVDPEAAEIRRAVAWLLSHQRADGGWGEAGESYWPHAPRGEAPYSTASQTAWALLALMAAGEVAHPAVARGIAYLIESQDRDGNWDEPWYTAVGFPRVFYLRYHGYRAFFPLFALARYRRLSLANSRRVAFGL